MDEKPMHVGMAKPIIDNNNSIEKRGIKAIQDSLQKAIDSLRKTTDALSSTRMKLEHSTFVMHCHEETRCRGDYCTLHNRSNHHMRFFRQQWRPDRGIIERVCNHGIGHPDPDEYRVRVGLDDGVHGCDGCCAPPRVS